MKNDKTQEKEAARLRRLAEERLRSKETETLPRTDTEMQKM